MSAVTHRIRRILSIPPDPKAVPEVGMEAVFTGIYFRNRWQSEESRSGTGSNLTQTETVRAALSEIIRRFGIRSVLDAPCGDFNWMKRVDLDGVDYTGADIVGSIISHNQSAYQRDNVRFIKLDLAADSLPKADLIFCRDCIVHLSFADALSAFRNMVESGSTYLLATTFTNRSRNIDIKTGNWRVLNLQQSPFSFPPPVELINENCTEKNGVYADKSLGLWRLDDIKHLLNTDRA